jgi:hypothetical protein
VNIVKFCYDPPVITGIISHSYPEYIASFQPVAPSLFRWYSGFLLSRTLGIIPPQMPLEDMEIIYAVLSGSVIREGFGKLSIALLAFFEIRSLVRQNLLPG